VDPKEIEKLLADKLNETPATGPKDGTSLLIIKELVTSLPGIVKQIKEAKAPLPVNPVQQGLEEAVRELSKSLTLQILNESPELMSNLRAMLEDGLASSLLPGDEPDGEEEAKP
jgi:hypothetical protein